MNEFEVNSFQLPNALVDILMKDMSPNALKCYLVIVRKTKGWGKEWDTISIAQLKETTGIKQDDTIYKVVKELIECGLIETVKNLGKMTFYRVAIKNKVPPKNSSSTKKSTTPKKQDWVLPKNRSSTTPKKQDTTKDTTKTTLTKETLSPLSSLTTKESSVQKTSEREDEREENKKFLSFVNQIRKEYAPAPEQNIFPRIMQVRDSNGNVSAFKIDNKGHLYLSSPSGTRDLTSAEADRYWHLIFQNKDRLFPNGDWHPNINIDLSPCNPQGQSEPSPHPTKEVNGAT
jgi:hypothetical protein